MTTTQTRMTGVVIGLVRDVDDPENDGRIRVSFPWLGDDVISGWAPVAAPLGGNNRGYYYMPELDDEALVAFELGDFDHPFVLGFLHNGADSPPTGGIDKQVRRIKSVAGHVVDLDDRAGSEKVHVKTHDGHVLDLRDSDGTIQFATAGGQHVKMTDRPAQLELKTAAGTTVTMSDAPSSVTVHTVTGVELTVSDTGVTITSGSGPVMINTTSVQINSAADVSVTAPTISLNAAAIVVDAPFATFTGILNCEALITNAVVSSSYTPGAGNIW